MIAATSILKKHQKDDLKGTSTNFCLCQSSKVLYKVTR